MPLPLSNFFFRRRRPPPPPPASPPAPQASRPPPALLVGKSTRRPAPAGTVGTHVHVLRPGWTISVHPHYADNLLLEHLSSQASSSPAAAAAVAAAAAAAAAVGKMPSLLSMRRSSSSSKRKQQQMYQALGDDACVEEETQILPTIATHHVAMQPIYLKFLLIGMQRFLAEAHSPLAWHDRRRASFDWQHGPDMETTTTGEERILKLVISEKAARMPASELVLVVEAWRHGVPNEKGGEQDVLLARGEIDNVCEHLYQQGKESSSSSSSSNNNNKEQEGMLVLPLAYVGAQENGHKSFGRRRSSKQKNQAEVGFSLTYLPPSRPRHCHFPEEENERTVIIEGGTAHGGEGEEYKEEEVEEAADSADARATINNVLSPRHSIQGFLQAEEASTKGRERRMAEGTHTHTAATASVSPEVAAARLMESLRVESELALEVVGDEREGEEEGEGEGDGEGGGEEESVKAQTGVEVQGEKDESEQEEEEEESEMEADAFAAIEALQRLKMGVADILDGKVEKEEEAEPSVQQADEAEEGEETVVSDEIEREEEEEEEEEEKTMSSSSSSHRGRPPLSPPPKASPQAKHNNNNNNNIHTWKARRQHRRQQVARVRGLLDELECLPHSLEEIDSKTCMSFSKEKWPHDEEEEMGKEEEEEQEEGQMACLGGDESRIMTQKLVELILQERNQRMACMR